jgi:hypothetical protein
VRPLAGRGLLCAPSKPEHQGRPAPSISVSHVFARGCCPTPGPIDGRIQNSRRRTGATVSHAKWLCAPLQNITASRHPSPRSDLLRGGQVRRQRQFAGRLAADEQLRQCVIKTGEDRVDAWSAIDLSRDEISRISRTIAHAMYRARSLRRWSLTRAGLGVRLVAT